MKCEVEEAAKLLWLIDFFALEPFFVDFLFDFLFLLFGLAPVWVQRAKVSSASETSVLEEDLSSAITP